MLVAGYKEATAIRFEDVYSAKVSVSPFDKKVHRVIVTDAEHACIGRDLINNWTVTLRGKQGIIEIEEG